MLKLSKFSLKYIRSTKLKADHTDLGIEHRKTAA